MLWQLTEVFGTLHHARLREESKSMNRLTHINPTVVKGIQEIKEDLLTNW